MGWVGLHQFRQFCTKFQAVMKRTQKHPNTMKRTKTWVSGPIGWIGCIRCDKFWHNFVARTFALIAPVQLILHQVLGRNETIPNASKHCKTHQKGALRSNGLCWVRSMWKISTRIHGTNFCIIAPVKPILYRVSCSNETIPNAPKHYKMH